MPKTAITVLCLFAAAAALNTQGTGTIRGTVSDSSAAVIPAVSITVLNVESGTKQTSVTDGAGIYAFPNLQVGNYSVSMERAGFRRSETTGVRVDVATVSDVNVTLAVGTTDQSVEITAAAPLLETNGSNLGKVVETRAITDLPLFISGGSVRSNLAFVILTPGVIGPATNPRIGGGLLDGQSEQLDGAESNSERRNDPAMNGVSVEGMEEFKVQSSGYSAEYGRTSNGVINWVTKSGTNQIHGSAFVFNRNEVFNARGFTPAASKRPIVRQWNPGGSIGGPIYIPKLFDGRNKAFFFFAYERASTRNGQSTALVTAPLDEFRDRRLAPERRFDGQDHSPVRSLRCQRQYHPECGGPAPPAMQWRSECDLPKPHRPNREARLIALLPHPDNPNSDRE